MSTFREDIESAASELDTYKHPDVSEVQRRLHNLLIAGGLGGIEHDRLDALTISGGVLRIRTSYSVRGCAQRGDFEIPTSVIDSADPIKAMKVLAKKRRLDKAKVDVADAKRALASAEKRLAAEEAKS